MPAETALEELHRQLSAVPDQALDATVSLSRAESVAVVTLSRPDMHNALDLASWERLAEIFEALASDERLRATVVRGAGDRAFSAGADIAEFPERRMSAATARAYNRSIGQALDAIMDCPVPVLAMVRGVAVGGGCELAAACDLRIVGRDARFGIPISRLGVTLGYAEARALTRLIGGARVKDLLFTGRLVDAQEARQMGLADRMVPEAQLVDATVEIIRMIVAGAPVTIRAAKFVADLDGRALTVQEADLLAAFELQAYEGSHLKEGVSAFLEHRKPDFEGVDSTRRGRRQ